MQLNLIIGLAIHVLSAVFWAGSAFVLARTGGAGFERLWGPQLGAAAAAILSGGYLWSVLHRDVFASAEQILAAGIAVALIAAALQAIGGVSAARALRRDGEEGRARRRAALIQRVSAACLVLTVICMATARYV